MPDIVAVLPFRGSVGGGSIIIPLGSNGKLEIINTSALSTISSIQGILSVQRIYFDRETSLVFSCPYGTQVISEDTTSPVTLIGLEGVSGATSPVITSGRDLNRADENSTNALVGQQYAIDANLSVGDSLSIGRITFHLVGIFQASSACQGDVVILPYPAGIAAGNISNPEIVYLYINPALNTSSFVSSLQKNLGSSYTVESLATADYSTLQNAISSILTFSEIGEYTALSAEAAIIMVVIVLVTSHRTREVGLLKALGYSEMRILGQIIAESLIIVLVGFPLALGLALIAGPSLAHGLLGNAANDPNTLFLQNVSFALTPETLLLGVAITVSFGLIGALYPTIKAVFLRPSEALRQE